MSARGMFIVIEGGDGAGKDTQIDLLRETLGEEQFCFVKDPGGTDIGWQLREIVLHNDATARSTELLIYLASRAQLVEEVIKPALAAGTHVIANRFDLSTISYQVYGRERLDMLDFVKDVSTYARGGIVPDLLIYLDCPPEVGLARLAQGGAALDRFETEQLAFHARVHEGYRRHIHDYEHVVVDATASPEAVHRMVRTAIDAATGARA